MLLQEPCTVLLPGTQMIFEDHAFPEQLRAAEAGFACQTKAVANLGKPTDNLAWFPSYKHGRSFVFWQHDGPLETAPRDQHGIPYYAASVKGAVLGEERVEPFDYETDGFRINGLQNAKDGAQAILKSQYLRSSGVRVEWIFGAARPTQLPFITREYPTREDSAELIPSAQFMSRLWEETEHRLYIPGLRDLVLSFDPLVTYRLQQSALRIWDLSHRLEARKERYWRPLDSYVEVILQDLEPTLVQQGLIDQREVGRISTYKAKIILAKYFLNNFPVLLAKNLSTFWEKGFRHNFLHGGNVSLAGEIVDSESITGPFPWVNTEQGNNVLPVFEDYFTLQRNIVPGLQSLGIHLELDDDKYKHLGNVIFDTLDDHLTDQIKYELEDNALQSFA